MPSLNRPGVLTRSEQLTARVLGLVSKEFGVDVGTVDRGTALDDLQLDSLARVELAMVLEDAFDVGVPDSELARVATIGDLCDVIARAALPPAPIPHQ